MNPPLKLFFYSQILANNNLSLKIYCENIVVTFLNFDFLFFILFFFFSLIFFHPYVLFFFLLFFLLHTRIPTPIFIFSSYFVFLLDLQNILQLSLSLFLSLSLSKITSGEQRLEFEKIKKNPKH